MKTSNLYELFIEELEDMYSCENQIIKALPKMIKLASLPDLKEGLANHLEETKKQSRRIEKILSMLDIVAEENMCEGMEGILKEGEELLKNHSKSPILDAAIISAAQKIEHYEMASYGTLRSYAKLLNLDSEIVDMLQESLDEEGHADKSLTKLAEGSFFSSGVNKKAIDFERTQTKRKVI